MVSKIIKSLCIVQLAILFASCSNMQNVAYIKNYESYQADTTRAQYEMRFQPKDVVDVLFFQPEDQSVVLPMALQAPAVMKADNPTLVGSSQSLSYIIDNEGNIEIPLLGKVHIAGETKKSAEAIIKEKPRICDPGEQRKSDGKVWKKSRKSGVPDDKT